MPFWAATVLAAGVCAAGCALGAWQLGRAADKRALQAAVDSRTALSPLDTDQAVAAWSDPPAAVQRRARLQGRWLAGHSVLLDNRSLQGRAGFFLLTPLALPGGGAVLVQRGWLPRNFMDRAAVSPVSTPAGTVVVEGRLVPMPSRLLELGRPAESAGPAPAGVPRIRQNLDLDALRAETGLSIAPLTLLQTGPDNDTDGRSHALSRAWPAPATGVDKHYGYAFQWFGLAALSAFLYVWFQFIRPRRARPA